MCTVCRDEAALSAMSGTASLRVAAGENDDDEIKILHPAEGAATISLAAVRIDRSVPAFDFQP